MVYKKLAVKTVRVTDIFTYPIPVRRNSHRCSGQRYNRDV